MPYSLRLTRNTTENRVTVHEITRAPEGVRPGKKWMPENVVEAVQIFETREEAEKARAAELLAADFSALPPEKLLEILRGDLDRVAFFGLSMTALTRLCDLHRNTLLAYAYGKRDPNPRTVAKIHVLADLCENVANLVRVLLPEEAGCGNPAMGRKGNPKIYTYSPAWKAREESRGISQSGT